MNIKEEIFTKLRESKNFEEFEAYSKKLSKEISQKDLYTVYTEILQELDSEDEKYDFVADTLDYIHGGPWAKGKDFYKTKIS